VPPHVLKQSEVARAAELLFADRVEAYGRLSQVFASTGIQKRHSVVPMEWFLGRIG
jgi:alkylresorcinol/alkylpyrone synthase